MREFRTHRPVIGYIALYLCLVGSLSAADIITVPTNKSHVIPIKVREQILEVAENYVSAQDIKEVSLSSPLQNPFTPEDETAVRAVAKQPLQKKAASTEADVVYDARSILQAVANSFTKQIRGTLARGEVNYLQLQGGGLLKNGTVFPARIPEIPNKEFKVTISQITSNSYTLSMAGESLEVSLDKGSDRAVRYSQ